MSAVKDLTKGSPMKLILGFMLPMLLGLLFQQFYNMVDTIVVGQFLGVNALAGVGSTGSVNLTLSGSSASSLFVSSFNEGRRRSRTEVSFSFEDEDIASLLRSASIS